MEYCVLYIILLIIPILSTIKVVSINKYKNKKNKRDMTGCEVAHDILDNNNKDAYILLNKENFNLYIFESKTIKLTQDVYDENSIYALCVGALKGMEAVDPNKKFDGIKNYLLEPVKLGTVISYLIFIIGLVANLDILLEVAIALMIISLIYNGFMVYNDYRLIEKTIKTLSKESYIDKDEKKEIKEFFEGYKYLYMSNIITYIKDSIVSLINRV